MRTIRYTNQFKRDYRREKSGKSSAYGKKVDDALMETVMLLAVDTPLPASKFDGWW
jgi:mRNA interferase YafQ